MISVSQEIRFVFVRTVVALVAGLCAVTAYADPPGRAGRLSYLDGEVAVRRAESREWETPSVNWPLTSGDALTTEHNARAELRIGSGVARLDEDTAIRVERLDDDHIRLRLDDGAVQLRVRSSDPSAAIEVETPDGRATAAEPGSYRVEFIDGVTVLQNYRGQLDFRSETRHMSVTEGQRVILRRDGDARWSAAERDDFYEWARTRDARDDRAGEERYVSREMTGVEDLYEYGDWRDSPEYGSVWYPRTVAYDWAPYRYGRWVWVSPWGWSWVDDAPWGFAPFHYGRWVRIRDRWAWAPGRYVERPVYAPAMVAWVGVRGAVLTISTNLRDLSWYPLAPREVYVPYYRYSPTYVRQVNVTHVTNVVEVTRVIEAPQRARHVFRDRREAITRASESVLRPARVVEIDPVRRQERLAVKARTRELREPGAETQRLPGVRERTELPRPDRREVREIRPEAVPERREERRERVDALRDLRPEAQRREVLQQQEMRERRVPEVEERRRAFEVQRDERRQQVEERRQQVEERRQQVEERRQQVEEQRQERRQQFDERRDRQDGAREARIEAQRREDVMQDQRRQAEVQRAEQQRHEAQQQEVLRRREEAMQDQRRQAEMQRVEQQRREVQQQEALQRRQEMQEQRRQFEERRERMEQQRDERRAESEQRQRQAQEARRAEEERERARQRQREAGQGQGQEGGGRRQPWGNDAFRPNY